MIEIDAIIEIPEGTRHVKYEIEPYTDYVRVDRFLKTKLPYPANYGFIDGTLAEDGDCLDVLVVTPAPVQSNSIISIYIIGYLDMSDEKGRDIKIVAVPSSVVSPTQDHIANINDIDDELLDEIKTFFTEYKKGEEGKFTKVKNFYGKREAFQEYVLGRTRYIEAQSDIDKKLIERLSEMDEINDDN